YDSSNPSGTGSSPTFGANHNAFPSFNSGPTQDQHFNNGFTSSSPNFGRDGLRTSDARNANFPPMNNDPNRPRIGLPTASIMANNSEPGFTTTFASLLLSASLGGNIYRGWLARDFYWRYRDMAWKMRGSGSSAN